MFGSAESEHPRLTNREIISEEFQPMRSQSTNVTDGRTDDMGSHVLHMSDRKCIMRLKTFRNAQNEQSD